MPNVPNLMRTSRRLILRDHVDAPTIRAFAENSGWRFVGDTGDAAGAPEGGLCYEAKWAVDDGGSVHYVVDEFADVHYMVTAHAHADAAEATLADIENGLAVWTLDELLDDCYVHVYPAGWAKALLRLGAGAPPHAVEPVVEHVTYSAGHEDAPVRRAALWAMAYTAWPEFENALARIADTDRDPQVAREARLALEQLAESGVIEPGRAQA
ncbi:HEAT repeat domain-containing protein [Streptomyces odontomachi]|uniref:HEAT repeat domain-containing protein n=1 Tax=Streptomyces odontomachi TaxID=2944940 RepID=UPI002108934B|nr:HEAT repeat domain-containing protein [Streptomyces sp. ODS25]